MSARRSQSAQRAGTSTGGDRGCQRFLNIANIRELDEKAAIRGLIPFMHAVARMEEKFDRELRALGRQVLELTQRPEQNMGAPAAGGQQPNEPSGPLMGVGALNQPRNIDDVALAQLPVLHRLEDSFEEEEQEGDAGNDDGAEAANHIGMLQGGPHIEPFTGEDNMPVSQWLRLYSDFARAQSKAWTEDEKLQRLPFYLRGGPREKWDEFTAAEKATFQAAATKLQAVYENSHSRDIAKMNLARCRQRAGESINDFVERLRKLVKAVTFGDGEEAFRSRFRDEFIDRLDKDVSFYVKVLAPTTMEDAICQAMRFEGLLDAKKQESSSINQVDEIAGRVIAALNISQTPAPSGSNGGNSRGGQPRRNNPVECFNCGKMGHIKRECRSQRQTQGNNQGGYGQQNQQGSNGWPGPPPVYYQGLPPRYPQGPPPGYQQGPPPGYQQDFQHYGYQGGSYGGYGSGDRRDGRRSPGHPQGNYSGGRRSPYDWRDDYDRGRSSYGRYSDDRRSDYSTSRYECNNNGNNTGWRSPERSHERYERDRNRQDNYRSSNGGQRGDTRDRSQERRSQSDGQQQLFSVRNEETDSALCERQQTTDMNVSVLRDTVRPAVQDTSQQTEAYQVPSKTSTCSNCEKLKAINGKILKATSLETQQINYVFALREGEREWREKREEVARVYREMLGKEMQHELSDSDGFDEPHKPVPFKGKLVEGKFNPTWMPKPKKMKIYPKTKVSFAYVTKKGPRRRSQSVDSDSETEWLPKSMLKLSLSDNEGEGKPRVEGRQRSAKASPSEAHDQPSGSGQVQSKAKSENCVVSKPKVKQKCKEKEQKAKKTVSFKVNTVVMTVTMALCLMLCGAAAEPQGNEALICHNRVEKTLWRIPAQVPCPKFELDQRKYLEPMQLSIYRPNTIQYESDAWVCKIIRESARVFTSWEGSSFETPRVQEYEHVSPTECKRMKDRKVCDYGSLSLMGEIWRTDKPLDLTPPGWWSWGWKDRQTTNCFVYETKVFAKHGSTKISTPAGEVDDCSYSQTMCNLANGAAIVWTPADRQKCRYIQTTRLAGQRLANTWLANSKEFALSFPAWQEREPIDDCGDRLIKADQGYAVPLKELEKKRREKRESSKAEDDVGIVYSNQLAAQLQALELGMLESLKVSFQHTLMTLCDTMSLLHKQLQNAAMARPTLAARQLLKREDVQARAVAQNVIEVWPCVRVPKESFSFRNTSGAEKCYEYPPVVIQYGADRVEGFLDPVTRVVSRTSRSVPCELVRQQTVVIYGDIHQLDQKTGKQTILSEAAISDASISEPIYGEHPEAAVTIFRNMMLANISEVFPSMHLDAVVHDWHMQEQLAKGAASPAGTPTGTASSDGAGSEILNFIFCVIPWFKVYVGSISTAVVVKKLIDIIVWLLERRMRRSQAIRNAQTLLALRNEQELGAVESWPPPAAASRKQTPPTDASYIELLDRESPQYSGTGRLLDAAGKAATSSCNLGVQWVESEATSQSAQHK